MPADIKAQGEPIAVRRNIILHDSNTKINKAVSASSTSELSTTELISQINNLTESLKVFNSNVVIL